MGRSSNENYNGQAASPESGDTHIIQANGQDVVALPGGEFVQDAEILRDGQDLLLKGPDGTIVVVEGYFNADPAPALQAPGGETLTPELVQSFVQQSGPGHYASNQMMNDASPVGAVQEISGKATVTHSNGITETIKIGTPIYEGDIIETAGNGAVNIMFIDESTFAVSQNARLAIDEYVFDPASQTGESDFSILRGIFVFTSGLIGRDDPDDVELTTPMGSIGIRGTVIAGNVDTGEITVMEGAIVLRDLAGNEVTLAEQYQTARFQPATGDIAQLGKITPEDFSDTFGGVKTVAPDLFTAINDQQAFPAAPAPEQSAPTGTTQPAPAPRLAPDEQTSLSPDGTLQPQPSLTGTDPNAPLKSGSTTDAPAINTDTSFDGTADSGFEKSAGTDTSDPTGTNTSLSGTVGTATQPTGGTVQTSGPGDMQTTNTDPTTTDPNILPPPDVIAGGGGGTAPPPADPHHLFLGNIISSGSTVNGYFTGGTTGQNLGNYVTAAGDFNNDGKLDFFVGDDRATAGKIFVYDHSGAELSGGGITAPGTPTSSLTAAGIGDMDGDGQADFITGAPDSGAGSAGNAQLFLSGAGLVSFTGQTDNSGGSVTTDHGDMLANSVAGIGDINGDGYNDLLIGAAGRDIGSQDDAGSAYVVFGSNTVSASINISAIGGDGIAFNGTNTNDLYGSDVSGAGDLNNDGFADFMISRPGAGEVDIYFGSASAPTSKTITGLNVDPADPSIPMFNLGDMDGDGIGEIGLASTNGAGAVHVFSGAALAAGGATIGTGSAMSTYTPDAGFKIIGGGAAGDFNGDGFADGVLAFQNGTSLEVFVVYGGGITGNVGMGALANSANAFRMSLDLGAHNVANLADFDVSVSNPGDLNGDGFDDIVLGMDELQNGNGGFFVVNGRNADAIGADGNMVHIAGQTTALNDVIANGASQHLVGNAANNTRGGDGDDLFVLNNANLGNIDGGNGFDTIQVFGSGLSLDFTAMGEESLSGIEKFALQNGGQTVTIGMNDIFDLLQSSQNEVNFGGNTRKTVIFSNDSGGSANLNIEDHGTATPFTLGTPDDSTTVAGYDAYFVGDGYALLIESDVSAAIV